MDKEHHETHESHSEGHLEDVKTLLSWKAPGRPFKKKGREYFASLGLIILFVETIAFLFNQFELMLAIAALGFLTAVLSSVPPKEFHYKITSEGIQIEDLFYIWEELYDFYFNKINGAESLVVRTHALLPGELQIPIEEHAKDHIRKTLIQFISFREVVRPTFMEKSANWLARTFPLDKIREERESTRHHT